MMLHHALWHAVLDREQREERVAGDLMDVALQANVIPVLIELMVGEDTEAARWDQRRDEVRDVVARMFASMLSAERSGQEVSVHVAAVRGAFVRMVLALEDNAAMGCEMLANVVVWMGAQMDDVFDDRALFTHVQRVRQNADEDDARTACATLLDKFAERHPDWNNEQQQQQQQQQ